MSDTLNRDLFLDTTRNQILNTHKEFSTFEMCQTRGAYEDAIDLLWDAIKKHGYISPSTWGVIFETMSHAILETYHGKKSW